jgi:Secretion system C-terminal sorting domain
MRIFTLGIFLILTNSLLAQFPCWTGTYLYTINFDDGQCMEGLYIDTVSNVNNIWQIGIPQKNSFNNASSAPNSIVTDTIDSYPINDTSSFIISHLAGAGFYYYHTASIEGYYMVNTDSLNDFGRIELSPDNGNTWIDIINDNSVSSAWNSQIPTLTGNSNGWQYFNFDVLATSGLLGIIAGDTIKYRFTFVSDSIFDSLDGLIFDSFYFQDWVEGIHEIGFNKMESKAFPNPAMKTVTIEFDNSQQTTFELKVMNIQGEEILKRSNLKGNSITIDGSILASGIYTYTLQSTDNKIWSSGKIIKVNE